MVQYPVPGDPTLFVLLSGPSGAGKSTLLRRFLHDHPDFAMSVSATTRAPRPGERDGVDYHFLAPEEFARRVAANGFLEYAQVFGTHWYGTPREFVLSRFAEGRSVIKDVDVQGAAQIARNFPNAVMVFVVPSTRDEIERRLRGRSTDGEEVIRRRLDECERELMQWPNYHYLVVNDDLDRAAADLSAVVHAERLRIARAVAGFAGRAR